MSTLDSTLVLRPLRFTELGELLCRYIMYLWPGVKFGIT